MVSELTVTIKDEEKTLRTKYLSYDKYSIDENDPYIQQCIDETRKNFQGEPKDVYVSIRMDIL